jgi:ADP-ribose pyrophosphatase
MKFLEALKQLKVWQVLKRDPVFDCPPWLSLWRETIRLPDGREIDDYYQLEQRDYVEIAAWQNNKVFGLWRYKHGPRRVNLGLPAGYLESGEDPLDAARRELNEEAGLTSENWRHLGSYCIDGNRGQARAHIYVAHDCRSIEGCPSDDLEEQIGEWLTPRQWAEQLAAGRVATLGAAMTVYAGIFACARQPDRNYFLNRKGEIDD